MLLWALALSEGQHVPKIDGRLETRLYCRGERRQETCRTENRLTPDVRHTADTEKTIYLNASATFPLIIPSIIISLLSTNKKPSKKSPRFSPTTSNQHVYRTSSQLEP